MYILHYFILSSENLVLVKYNFALPLLWRNYFFVVGLLEMVKRAFDCCSFLELIRCAIPIFVEPLTHYFTTFMYCLYISSLLSVPTSSYLYCNIIDVIFVPFLLPPLSSVCPTVLQIYFLISSDCVTHSLVLLVLCNPLHNPSLIALESCMLYCVSLRPVSSNIIFQYSESF